MKTKEELNALKNEVEALNKKLAELTNEELTQVTGGQYQGPCITYKVKLGDCLSNIAREHGTTVKILCELNNIADPLSIYAGQKLLIPIPIPLPQ